MSKFNIFNCYSKRQIKNGVIGKSWTHQMTINEIRVILSNMSYSKELKKGFEMFIFYKDEMKLLNDKPIYVICYSLADEQIDTFSLNQ